jgi:hypothetical protein
LQDVKNASQLPTKKSPLWKWVILPPICLLAFATVIAIVRKPGTIATANNCVAVVGAAALLGLYLLGDAESRSEKRLKRLCDAVLVICAVLAAALLFKGAPEKPRMIDAETSTRMKEILQAVAHGEPRPHVSIGYRKGMADETTAPLAEAITNVLSSAGWDADYSGSAWDPAPSERDMEGICFMAQGGPDIDALDERQEALLKALALIEGPCVANIPQKASSVVDVGLIAVGRRSSSSRSAKPCLRRRGSCLEATPTPGSP